MNHFHRVIFNRALGVRQVVSEIAGSGRGTGTTSTVSSSGLCQMPRLSALAAACLLAWCAAPQAQAATCNAATSAELVTCISNAAAGDTVNLISSIVLSANLGPIDKNLTINGNGTTLDGADTYRGFFVQQGTVNISNLTILRATAQGGSGGGNGGGGMGAGGGLFVNTGAAVTLSNVLFDSNRAIGGSGTDSRDGGGGGGMEGAGGNRVPTSNPGGGLGGGGGFGGTTAFPPSAGGALTGSGGAAGNSSGGGFAGGNGGVFAGGGGGLDFGSGGTGGDFAGGGGGATNCGSGGTGGFGGGGGGGGCGSTSARSGGAGGFGGGGGGNGGAAGFGGGSGGAIGGGVGGGGAGAGFGGAVFVRNGGNLTIAGNSIFQSNSVAGGAGAGSTSGGGTGGNGSSGGTNLFLQGNGNLGYAPGAGVTNVLDTATIADQSSLGGTGGNAGVWGLVKTGGGTLQLNGVAGFSGTVQINQGTVTTASDGSHHQQCRAGVQPLR